MAEDLLDISLRLRFRTLIADSHLPLHTVTNGPGRSGTIQVPIMHATTAIWRISMKLAPVASGVMLVFFCAIVVCGQNAPTHAASHRELFRGCRVPSPKPRPGSKAMLHSTLPSTSRLCRAIAMQRLCTWTRCLNLAATSRCAFRKGQAGRDAARLPRIARNDTAARSSPEPAATCVRQCYECRGSRSLRNRLCEGSVATKSSSIYDAGYRNRWRTPSWHSLPRCVNSFETGLGPTSGSFLTPVWKVRIASCAR